MEDVLTALRYPRPCDCCLHYMPDGGDPETGEPTGQCVAFPDGIPAAVRYGRYDHRNPLPGDHGIQWTADERVDFEAMLAEYEKHATREPPPTAPVEEPGIVASGRWRKP